MLLQSKSNLARLMATENIIIEQRKVPTAFFDIENRILTIPVLDGNLSPELYDLLLGHEVGHALETPAEGWHNSIVDLKVNRTILNVCEDARIEKKIKRKFPGIRSSFVKGYKELMQKDFFGVKNTNLNDLNFIDRINLYTKGGASQGIIFLDEELSLLNEVENTETFDDVVKVAIKIQEFMKDALEKESKSQKLYEQVPFDCLENGEEYEMEMSDYSESDVESSGDEDSPIDEEAKDNTEENKARETQDFGKRTLSTKQKEPSVSTSGRTGSLGEKSINSKTDETFRNKEKELHSNQSKGMLYVNIPDVNLDKTVFDYKELATLLKTDGYISASPKAVESYNSFKRESNKVVSYLVKEFELRKNAEQQSRAKVSKTGELNLNKIHEFRFTDDIFARLTNVPNGKSHGLVMFLDWSGSMSEYMLATIKQLLNLVWFCKKVNIPFEVYGFSSHLSEKNSSSSGDCFNKSVGNICLDNFSLLNILSSRMNSREFTHMATFLFEFGMFYGIVRELTSSLFHLSGTPLNECVVASFRVVEEFKKRTKAQIVNTVFLTDGDGNSITGYVDGKNRKTDVPTLGFFRYYDNRIIYRDPVTKSSCMVNGYAGNSSEQTITLLKLLKERVGGNVIGFFIGDFRSVRETISSYDTVNTPQRMTEFRKNKFTFIEKSGGYDEYYFLRSDKMDTEEDVDFEVKNTTTRGLVSAFSKYTNNRVSNRLVLNRFIHMIS